MRDVGIHDWLVGGARRGTAGPSITVTTQPKLDITQLLIGAQIGDAWVAGAYSAPTGACTEGAPNYVVNGLPVAATYVLLAGDLVGAASVTVTAPAGLSLLVPAYPVPFASFTVSAADFRGYQVDTDHGTTGDKFVAPGGSNANPGTLAQPYATIDYAAINNPGANIKVRGGVYPALNITSGASGSSGTHTRISRYGTEDVLVRGSTTLSSLARCTVADAPDVGPLWNSIFKQVVTIASIASGDMEAANPIEGMTPLALAGEFGGDKSRWPVEGQCLWDNDNRTPVLNAGNIEGYIWDLDAYPSAQLLAARVNYYKTGNLTATSLVESYNAGTNTLTLVNKGNAYAANTFKDRVSIRNLPYAIKKGQWAWIDHGDGTATIYIFPNDEASIASNIFVATEDQLCLINNVDYLDIKGIRFTHCASASGDPNDYLTGITVLNSSYVTLENVELSNTFRPAVRHNGALLIETSSNCSVDTFTVKNVYGAFGMMVSNDGTPTTPTDFVDYSLVRRGRFVEVAYSPVRMYNARRCAVVHCLFAGSCGICPHSNKLNGYQGCMDILVLGCNLIGAFGYVTYQEACSFDMVSVYALGNFSSDDARAVWDQGGGGGDPVDLFPGAGFDGSARWLNCRIDGDPEDPTNSQGIGIGFTGNMHIHLKNSILMGTDSINAPNVTRYKNIVTRGATSGGSEIFEARGTAFEGFDAAGDLRVKVGSVIRSTVGDNVTADITFLKARYPHVPAGDWDLDMNGDAINWAAPPMGPAVNFDIETPGATFVTLATPSVAAVVGVPATWNAGYHQPGWQTPAFAHYRKLPADPAWSLIAGENGAAYTPVSGDVGYIIAREAYLNGARSFVVNSTPVASGYPLDDPEIAFTFKSSTNGVSFETASFTVQDRPLLVLALQRLAGTSEVTNRVTIGAAGRALGAGTTIPGTSPNAEAIRTNVQVGSHFIASPGTGSVTVQIDQVSSMNGIMLVGLYIDGATAVGTLGSAVNTAADVTRTQATTKTNCLVVYFGARHNAAADSDAAITGATQLYANFSGLAADDIVGAIGFEQAPTAASYDATLDTDTSSSIILASVIVECASSV